MGMLPNKNFVFGDRGGPNWKSWCGNTKPDFIQQLKQAPDRGVRALMLVRLNLKSVKRVCSALDVSTRGAAYDQGLLMHRILNKLEE